MHALVLAGQRGTCHCISSVTFFSKRFYSMQVCVASGGRGLLVSHCRWPPPSCNDCMIHGTRLVLPSQQLAHPIQLDTTTVICLLDCLTVTHNLDNDNMVLTNSPGGPPTTTVHRFQHITAQR